MRGLIVFAALLCAAAGDPVSRYASQQNLLTSLLDELDASTATSSSTSAADTTIVISPVSSSSTSTAALANEESIVASTPSSSPKPSPASTLIPSTEESVSPGEYGTEVSLPQLSTDETGGSKRRVVTYDQRQEGQYNIRADLENFVILLIPPHSSEGLNLLDFLRKYSYQRNAHTAKNKKRQHASSIFTQASKNRQTVKGGTEQTFNINSRSPYPWNVAVTPSKQTANTNFDDTSGSAQRFSEFIEGRTPYHVDISASDDEQSRLHPNRQVDVLPPPYPLAYQHLIKPYHLEAEPTVIQALPPAALHKTHAPSNFLESYNKLLNSGLQTAAVAEADSHARNSNIGSDLGYYRISRSIRSDNAPDSDPSTSLNSISSQKSNVRFVNSPIYRSEHSMGAAKLYPPIDVPRVPNSRTLNALGDDNGADQILDGDVNLRRFLVALSGLPRDDVELELDSSKYRDQDVDLLLNRYIERCAPGHRRDSYGMCREIEGY